MEGDYVPARQPPPKIDQDCFARFRASIEPEWIEEALAATGTATIRKRRLPAEQVIWLVLGMALQRDRSIADVVASLELALPGKSPWLAPSASVQARARLGDEPLEWLFNRCAETWAHQAAREDAWRGLALYGVDGTTLRVPDSEENRAHFGSQSGRWNGTSGYPLTRAVTLMALRSHLLAAMRFGSYGVDERVYAAQLWPLVPDKSLCIVDRNFLSAETLIGLQTRGDERHWLTRAKKNTRWTEVERLGKDDWLVEIEVNRQTRAEHPHLPRQWRVRAIRYARPGFPPQTLLTSLTDAAKYPAKEIVALYHERWEIELGFNEVKRVMLEREESIRSKSPRMVSQELWAIGLAYNLVRLEMKRIAREASVPATRISFKRALMLIEREWHWSNFTRSPGAIPKHLRTLREDVAYFVLPERRARSYPRAVKIKMSNYPRKRPRPLAN
jgi:hypothetical protein